jgi:hypothetical protein
MKIRALFVCLVFAAVAAAAGKPLKPEFRTSDRCIACHNQLMTPSGRDVSIGFDWRPSIMANSSRDPYWQASARRETIDHPQADSHIQDECSVCHMPIPRYLAKMRGQEGKIFTHLPFDEDKKEGAFAEDGVTCSVCHQITPEKLGTRDSFNGGFVIGAPDDPNARPEFGPFTVQAGQRRIMDTSTGGFQPTENTNQIKKSELCASCHTLYTTAYGPNGQVIGSLPEQVPFLEWQNSDYSKINETCQDCHMPRVEEPAPITRVFGILRDGMKQHVFVGGNFFILGVLNQYRDELETAALPEELSAAQERASRYLREKAASISMQNVRREGARLTADVVVVNRGGHKLPTAFPSRRAWLHVTVRDRKEKIVFESGRLRPDGSIVGNDNDEDKRKYEPHYTEITQPDQVQIYEDILVSQDGVVTTGLLTAVRYIKDNRLLPHGFDKNTPNHDMAVIGAAANDPNFTGAGDRVRYSMDVGDAQGPLQIQAELWYQPIGFRWAHNLEPYGTAPEPRRFVGYYESTARYSAQELTWVSATVQ